MLIKGILFDFDGVIVDSINVHKNAWGKAYEGIFNSKLPKYPTDHLTGKSSLKIAEFLCSKIGRIEETEKLAMLKLKILLNESPAPELLPGIHEMFTYLRQLKLPYGIASNAPRDYIKMTLQKHGLQVSEFVGYDEIPNPKPAPDAYLVCAEKCGIKKDDFKDVLVFEDSVTGIKSAISAGMIPIGVLTTHSESDLVKAGSKKCCSDLTIPLKEKWF